MLAAFLTTQMTVLTNRTKARALMLRTSGLRSFTRLQRGQTTVRLANCSEHWRHWMRFCLLGTLPLHCWVACKVTAVLFWGNPSNISSSEIPYLSVPATE